MLDVVYLLMESHVPNIKDIIVLVSNLLPEYFRHRYDPPIILNTVMNPLRECTKFLHLLLVF